MFVGAYREFGYEDGPSIRASLASSPYPERDAVIDYLRGGGRSLACGTGVNVDAITGELASLESEVRTDGEFSWSTFLAHYVEKYNLRLSSEFTERAVASYRRGD